VTYFAPNSLDDALDVLAAGAQIVAGGTDHFPAAGQSVPDRDLLDITRIETLRGIWPEGKDQGGGWWIGGATTWAEIRDADLPPAFCGLQQAAREVGARQIQNAATLGGNICNASPAADGIPPLLVLDAEVHLASVSGKRVIALSQFLRGVRKTARHKDEILIGVRIPPARGLASAFEKLGARQYLVISIAMVAVAVRLKAGCLDDLRVAVGACSPVATRLGALEQRLQGTPVSGLADPALVRPQDLSALAAIDDVRATAGYRLDAAAELIRRAMTSAAGLAVRHD